MQPSPAARVLHRPDSATVRRPSSSAVRCRPIGGHMRTTIVAVTILAGCGSKHPTEQTKTPTHAPTAQATPDKAKPKPPIDEAAPQGEIVTKQVEEMNSAQYGRPAKDFRKGAISK